MQVYPLQPTCILWYYQNTCVYAANSVKEISAYIKNTLLCIEFIFHEFYSMSSQIFSVSRIVKVPQMINNI